MKRLMKMLLILSFLYLLLQLAFKYLGNGHNISYEIKGANYTVKVDELSTFNRKNETDNYHFTFTVNNDKVFTFQTYYIFNKFDHVISNVEYFKNEKYECIYPVFKQKEQVTDILCMNNNIVYNYHTLKGKYNDLDQFAKDMEKNGYDITHWLDNKEKSEKDELGPITVYSNNVLSNHYVGVDNYSGIYLVNNYIGVRSLYQIPIFENESYEKPIGARSGRYYIVADYNSKHEFKDFYLVDLVYNDQKTLKYHSPISFNSYIQGNVGNAVYLFDKTNKKQYKIDAHARTIIEVGNEQTGIKYYNLGKMETRKAVEAVTNNLYFNAYQVETINGYSKVDKVGNESSGYYYLYKKVGNKYEVYRSNVQSKDNLTYLFSTSNINEIKYVEDYIYYKEGSYIKYYHDMTGVRTLVHNREFAFNNSLHYYVYK